MNIEFVETCHVKIVYIARLTCIVINDSYQTYCSEEGINSYKQRLSVQLWNLKCIVNCTKFFLKVNP